MSPIELALQAGAEWMESNKNHPDVEAFGCVAAAVADLASIAYGDKKETAGDAAVTKKSYDILERQITALEEALIDTTRYDERTMLSLHERLTEALRVYFSLVR